MKNRFTRISRRLFDAALNPFGVRLARVGDAAAGPVDARGSIDNPLCAYYRYAGRPFIIDVALDRCRILGPNGSPAAGGNPFVDTLIAYRAGRCDGYSGSPLQDYYAQWRPSTAAELLGLSAVSSATNLTRLEPHSAVLPWESFDPAERAARRRSIAAAESRRVDRFSGNNDGHPHWGPVSEAKGAIEFQRLVEVYRSIERSGFRYWDAHGGSVSAQAILVRNGSWCVLIRKGNHRLAALAALDGRSAPVRFGDTRHVLVHREDAAAWPHVRSGLFNRAQAVQIFDRLFDGRPPWDRVQDRA